MSHHFWPGRGLNTGLKASCALARALVGGGLAGLGDFDTFMRILRVREMQGRSQSMQLKSSALPTWLDDMTTEECIANASATIEREPLEMQFAKEVKAWRDTMESRGDAWPNAHVEDKDIEYKLVRAVTRPVPIVTKTMVDSAIPVLNKNGEPSGRSGWCTHLQVGREVSPEASFPDPAKAAAEEEKSERKPPKRMSVVEKEQRQSQMVEHAKDAMPGFKMNLLKKPGFSGSGKKHIFHKSVWDERFFVMEPTSTEMKYYKTEADHEKGKEPLGTVECSGTNVITNVSHCPSGECETKGIGKEFYFTVYSISSKREFKMRAKSQADLDALTLAMRAVAFDITQEAPNKIKNDEEDGPNSVFPMDSKMDTTPM